MEYIHEIGMRAHDLPARTPAELLEQTRELNIKYVQLALRKSFNGIDWTNHTFSTGIAAKIREDLGDLRISVLGSYIDLSADEESFKQHKAVFEQNMLFAKYLNAGVVGTETGVRLCSNREEDYKNVVRNLKELVCDAEKLGVMLGIEGVAVHPVNTPEMMKKLCDEINSPNMLVIFDPVNYITEENYMQQDEMIVKTFELLSDKLTAVHLKDFDIADGKKTEMRVGEGIFNVKLLFEQIRKHKPYIDVLLEGSSAEQFETERRNIMNVLG